MGDSELKQPVALGVSGDRLKATLRAYTGADGPFTGRVGDGRFVLRPKLRSIYTRLFPWYVVGRWTPEGEISWRFRPSARLGLSYAAGLVIAGALGLYIATLAQPGEIARLSPIIIVVIWTIQHAIMAFTAHTMTRQAFEKTIEVLSD